MPTGAMGGPAEQGRGACRQCPIAFRSVVAAFTFAPWPCRCRQARARRAPCKPRIGVFSSVRPQVAARAIRQPSGMRSAELERNPPPGYPTLAQSNVAATKAAIERYTAIVEAGGWKPVPDATVKPGEDHFADRRTARSIDRVGRARCGPGRRREPRRHAGRRAQGLSDEQRADAEWPARQADGCGSERDGRGPADPAQDQSQAARPS